MFKKYDTVKIISGVHKNKTGVVVKHTNAEMTCVQTKDNYFGIYYFNSELKKIGSVKRFYTTD